MPALHAWPLPRDSLSDHFWLVGAGTLNENSADFSYALSQVTDIKAGNIFGGSNLPPAQSTVTPTGFGSSEAAIVNDPVFGDCLTEYTDAGRFRGECTPTAFDLVT
jgi:hypothetical protein